MDNSKNSAYKTLNNKNKIIYKKKEHSMIISNKNNSILEQNNIIKKENYIIDNKKKIIKRKLLIPNNKCQFKKIDIKPKKIQETINKKIIINKQINKLPIRRKSCGSVITNSNNQLKVLNSSSNSPNKGINKNIKIKNLKNINNKHINSVKKEKINLIPKSPKNISIKLKNNYYIKNTSENNYNNIGIKIINNDKKNECPLCITKIDKRKNILNNNINNNNFNGNITYNNNVNLNFNNKDNLIYDLPKKIYISNKEMNFIKKNFNKSFDNDNENTMHIIKRNKLIRIPVEQNNFSHNKNEFPNNYNYHEITHLNSPNKTQNSEKIKYINSNERNNCYTVENNSLNAEEGFYNENNINKIPNNNYLIHNQSLSNFHKKIPIYDYINPNYSTVFTNKRQYYRNIILNEDYNNNFYLYRNKSYNNYKNIILSPKNENLDYSDKYIEIENEEIPEMPQKINFFGEEMLKRNKNYNFTKYEKSFNKNNYIPISISLEKKYKNKKIKLKKKHNSLNNINKRNNNNNKYLKGSSSFMKLQNKDNDDIYKYKDNILSNDNIKSKSKNNTSEKKTDFNKVNKIQKINRYAHNIVNRKKIKKLVMEKSLNEEFISMSNKKENKSSKLKDRISNYESSVIDNDSINEVIKEFEKEIEEEEKREKDMKKDENKKENNGIINDNSFKSSFFSDNDFSFLNKDSAKKKVHYYKTKNVDMEKNYDFAIYGTKNHTSKI